MLPFTKSAVPTWHVLTTRQRYSKLRFSFFAVCLLFIYYLYTTSFADYVSTEYYSFRERAGKATGVLYKSLNAYEGTWADDKCSLSHGVLYLENIASERQEYCEPAARTPQVSCFGSSDSFNQSNKFCMSSYMNIKTDRSGFDVSCQWKEQVSDANVTRQSPNLNTIPLFSELVTLSPIENRQSCTNMATATHTILVHRADPANFWTSILEVFSYTLTLDALSLVTDKTGRPVYEAAKHVSTTQVVIMDGSSPGPFIGLWHLLSPMPIIWPADLQNSTASCFRNVIMPLSAASNPLAEDALASTCTTSKILNVFLRRIYDFYHVTDARSQAGPLSLTFIDRKASRTLVGAQDLLTKVKMQFPDVDMKMVDLASMGMREQIEMMRNTDILVGAHGAGLAHSMFLPPRAAVVEILPSIIDKPKKYRNLAKIAGHTYFSVTGKTVTTTGGNVEDGIWGPDWKGGEVAVDEDKFLGIMNAAVLSVFHRGSLARDG